MYQKLKMNYELSKKMYEEYKNLIKIKGCYHNIAMIITRSSVEMLGDLKIGFGAWQIPLYEDNIFAKHCFLLKDNSVIDPTYFASGKNDNSDYMIFKTLSVDEYLEYLEKDNFDTSLPTFTDNMFNEIAIELLKEKIILIG